MSLPLLIFPRHAIIFTRLMKSSSYLINLNKLENRSDLSLGECLTSMFFFFFLLSSEIGLRNVWKDHVFCSNVQINFAAEKAKRGVLNSVALLQFGKKKLDVLNSAAQLPWKKSRAALNSTQLLQFVKKTRDTLNSEYYIFMKHLCFFFKNRHLW